MLHEIQLKGRLDQFWAEHSSHADNTARSSNAPAMEFDASLADALQPAIRHFVEILRNTQDFDTHKDAPAFNLDDLIAMVNIIKMDCAHAKVETAQVTTQLDQVTVERAKLITQLDQVTAERDALDAARNSEKRLVAKHEYSCAKMIGMVSRLSRML